MCAWCVAGIALAYMRVCALVGPRLPLTMVSGRMAMVVCYSSFALSRSHCCSSSGSNSSAAACADQTISGALTTEGGSLQRHSHTISVTVFGFAAHSRQTSPGVCVCVRFGVHDINSHTHTHTPSSAEIM